MFYVRSHRSPDGVRVMTVIQMGREAGLRARCVTCHQAPGRCGRDLGNTMTPSAEQTCPG
jgi:hypothetical protein